MKWETGTGASGAEERKAQSGEKGSSVEDGCWMVWDRKLTSDSLGGSSDLSVPVGSAAQSAGAHPERPHGWD